MLLLVEIGMIWWGVGAEDVHWQGVSAFAMARIVSVGVVVGMSGA